MNMLMSFAEFEREMITERIRDKVRAAWRKGQWTGGHAPLGYRSEKSRLLIHEEEEPWVKQVFQWYLEGVSALRISQRLNAAAVPLKTARTVRPNPWTKDLVLRILRNRLYVGELSCQGEFVVATGANTTEEDVEDYTRYFHSVIGNRIAELSIEGVEPVSCEIVIPHNIIPQAPEEAVAEAIAEFRRRNHKPSV